MWKSIKLENVCQIGDGNHSSNYPKASEMVEQGVPFLRAGNIQNGGISDNNLKFITPEKHIILKKGHLKKGDVLITNRGDIGKIAIVPKKFEGANLNSQIAWLRPDERLLSSYLYYFLKVTCSKSSFKSLQTGTALQQLTIREIKKLDILLPSLEEQKKIVVKLDSAFADIDKAINLARNKKDNVEKLQSSLLSSMLIGDLKTFKKVKLSELFNVGSSKRVLKSDWKNEGVPFYRGREITTLSKLDLVNNKLFITEEHYQLLADKYGVPQAGDIMVTAIGTIGNTYIVKASDKFYFKDASVLCLKRVSEVSSEYIQYFFKSKFFFSQLDKGNGATVDTLTIKKLASIVIAIPSITEQRLIVDKLDTAFAELENIKIYITKTEVNFKSLKETILKQELQSEAA